MKRKVVKKVLFLFNSRRDELTVYCPAEFNDDRSETLYACVVHESSRDASVNKPLLL